MPGMDGFEVCKILKSDEATKHIPIIMLTAVRRETESLVKGLELGADAFFTKPIDKSELTAQVRAMLRIKKAEDQLLREKNLLAETVQVRTAELKDSETKYQDLYDNAPDMFCSVDAKTEKLSSATRLWHIKQATQKKKSSDGQFLRDTTLIVWKKQKKRFSYFCLQVKQTMWSFN